MFGCAEHSVEYLVLIVEALDEDTKECSYTDILGKDFSHQLFVFINVCSWPLQMQVSVLNLCSY